jgi:hypothetical protein
MDMPTGQTGLHPQVMGAIIGATVAGLFAISSTAISHWREERKRREDFKRRDTEWLRDKILDAYSNSIYYLIKLSVSAVNKSTEDKEVRQHFTESQRHLLLLKAYPTNRLQYEIIDFCNAGLANSWDKPGQLANFAEVATQLVKMLLERDDRIRTITPSNTAEISSERDSVGHHRLDLNTDKVAGKSYAVCESGHIFWISEDKDTYAEAKAIGKKHDEDKHGGTTTAIILTRP